MLVRVLYHDHCFDGAASAAFFSRFLRGAVHPAAEFRYTGMAHTAAQTFDESLFDGDENAIVDFKYAASPRLTWWFDHHQSAFLTAADQEHYRADTSGRKLYDPAYKSCTSFIHDVARDRFGFHAPDLDDLVRWSVVIDGAQYADARTAVELGAPAMKLTLVIEAAKGSGIVQKIIGWMQERSLGEIVGEPEVQALYEPLYRRHIQSIDLIRGRARQDDSVVYFDLSGYDIEGYNKFIPYFLFPSSTYTVSISPSSFRTKISVGSNPWTPVEPAHNLASICERYGGGGHARVGAISLPPGQTGRAREIAAEIVAELKS
ncbi:MAG: phosphoesterase [Acidobacteriota bacterium]|nr:phosphoesterase [Acidobacteriota bacterium]